MAKSAEELLIYLFDEILPKHGMNLRVKQKELSLEMLRALQENKLALCEAEVGTGKTHAYILALTVHNIYSDKKIPAVISTSTIALQKALTEEYIPQISGILLEHHVIDKPLSFVVRKGKRHYVCDSRLKIYETSIKNLQREVDANLILELARLGEQEFDRIDLDDAVLTPYVKGRINVFRCNKSCPYSLLCRFMNFKKKCMTDSFDFQITNHNYILADLIGQKQGRKPLFPGYGAMVFDESHKLIDAARQMYSTVWDEHDAEFIVGLSEVNRRTTGMDELVENALQQQNELKALLANDSLTAEQKAAVKEALTALSSVDIVTNGKADGEYDKDGKADLAVGLASIKAATDTKSKEQNLYNGAAALDTTAQTMSGYAAQLRGSATQLLDGEKTVRDAITQISTNITKLSKGGKTLTANNKKLKKKDKDVHKIQSQRL